MPGPEQHRLPSRRAVLLGVALTACGVLNKDQGKAADAAMALPTINEFQPAGEYNILESDEFVVVKPVPFGVNQLVTEANNRLKEGLGQHKTAVVVVHPGYNDYSVDDIQKYYAANPQEIAPNADIIVSWRNFVLGAGGDYIQHRNNLITLTEQLKTAEVPVIYAIEMKDTQNDTIPLPSLVPPENAFVLVTKNAQSEFATTYNAKRSDGLVGLTFQKPHLLFGALRQSGVSDVLMAGEDSFNSHQKLACLGGVAKRFLDEGFRIKGIAGAVFPSLEPRRIKEGDAVRRGLYRESVPLDAISGLIH